MIIEHEAAGTLLKSTENRAGGFTCRINFYLVSSLPVPFSPSPFSSSPLPAPALRAQPLSPRVIYPAVTGFPLVTDYFFHRIGGNTHLPSLLLLSSSMMKFAFYKDKFNISRWTRFCLSSSSGGRGERADERKEWKYPYRGGEIEFFIQFCAWTKSLQDDSKREIYESLNSVFFLIRDKKVNKRKGRKFRSISDNKNFSRKLE